MITLVIIFRCKKVYDRVTIYPIFFNTLADILALLIASAKEDSQVEGLIPHLVDGGVSNSTIGK
jgi:hypothetical protein